MPQVTSAGQGPRAGDATVMPKQNEVCRLDPFERAGISPKQKGSSAPAE